MFRIRVFLTLIILVAGGYFAGPYLFRGYALSQVHSAFSHLGYPDATFDNGAVIGWSGLTLTNIQLDQGISTIDRIEATYSAFGLLRGQLDTVTIERPDLVYSAENAPVSTAKAPSDTPLSLRKIPIEQLTINDLNLSYAGDDGFNPAAMGKVTLLNPRDSDATLTFSIISEQRDLAATITGEVSEKRDGSRHLRLDVPEAKIDVPGIARLSRGNGKVDITWPAQGSPAIQGELNAGALKLGTLPLEGLTLVASGSKPDLSIIGNASITGVPQGNLSLRVTEDKKGARLLLQLSSNAPKLLADTLITNNTVAMPTQEKFVLALDRTTPTLSELLRPPYNARTYLYLDDSTPILTVNLDCVQNILTCKLTLPKTRLASETINRLLGPALAQQGLALQSGQIDLGAIASLDATQDDPAQSLRASFELTGQDLTFDWQNLRLDQANFALTRAPDGALALRNARANTLEGAMNIDRLDIDGKGNGQGNVNLQNIDMTRLSALLNIDGLEVSGQLSGKVPLTIRGGHIVADQGALLSSQNGTLHYTPPNYPSFLSGDDQRLEILRQAMRDYAFDALDISFSGDLGATLAATLAAKGRNAKLFEGRPVHINLNISGQLLPSLQQLVPNLQTITEWTQHVPETETKE